MTPEDTTNHGRIDMTVQLDDNKVYIFEFKVVDIDKTPGTALAQIRQKGYADKFRENFSEIYLIGVEFDRTQRNIIRFEWEQLKWTSAHSGNSVFLKCVISQELVTYF